MNRLHILLRYLIKEDCSIAFNKTIAANRTIIHGFLQDLHGFVNSAMKFS
jgi:hypothetical protein